MGTESGEHGHRVTTAAVLVSVSLRIPEGVHHVDSADGPHLATQFIEIGNSFVKDTVPLPGRNISAGFRSHF